MWGIIFIVFSVALAGCSQGSTDDPNFARETGGSGPEYGVTDWTWNPLASTDAPPVFAIRALEAIDVSIYYAHSLILHESPLLDSQTATQDGASFCAVHLAGNNHLAMGTDSSATRFESRNGVTGQHMVHASVNHMFAEHESNTTGTLGPGETVHILGAINKSAHPDDTATLTVSATGRFEVTMVGDAALACIASYEDMDEGEYLIAPGITEATLQTSLAAPQGAIAWGWFKANLRNNVSIEREGTTVWSVANGSLDKVPFPSGDYRLHIDQSSTGPAAVLLLWVALPPGANFSGVIEAA